MGFLQDVVEGTKKLILEYDVNFIKVPKWPEFAVNKIWPHAITNPTFLDYMPGSWGPGHRTAERAYFFKVLATVDGQWLWENIQRITQAREANKMIEVPKKPATLKISSDWAQKLMAMPLAPGKSTHSDPYPSFSVF